VTKSGWLRWVRHLAGVREMINAYKILVGIHEEKIPLEERIIL
jgi:hypothetical protein